MISIRTRIIITFCLITTILVVILARISFITVKENYLQQSSENVRRLSSFMGTHINKKYLSFLTSNDGEVKKMFTTQLREHMESAWVENVFIFNTSLQILAAAKNPISGSQLQLNKNEIYRLNTGESGTSFPFFNEKERWYIWGFYKISDNLYIGVEEDASRLETLNELAGTFFMIGLAGILLTVFAAWLIAYSITKPVHKLVNFSDQIGQGKFDVAAPQKVYGELEILKSTMVQMKNDLSVKNTEREQMLAQIAHEIRNPLGGIELLTGLVKEDVEPDSNAGKHLFKIQQEIKFLKEQLTLFLDYSKPLKAEPEETMLAPLIDEIKQRIRDDLARKKINFSYEGSLEKITFDGQQLKQVLTNLIVNSVDNVKSNGLIAIKSYKHDGKRMISISDNGPGIKAEHQPKIFTPFFTTKANGTGLGLAVSKKLCTVNNALLRFENNVSGGVTFKIIV
jgi:signal transduction histidine kinase